MKQFFFSGSLETNLDEKNRFVLPQSMRLGLVEQGTLEFTIALGLGGSLAIYRQSDMEKIVAKFRSKQHIARYQKFFTLFFSTLHTTTCDKIGRIVLPSVLKKAVGIEKEIVIAGVIDRIEIWPADRYFAQLSELFDAKEQSEIAQVAQEVFHLLDEECPDEEV